MTKRGEEDIKTLLHLISTWRKHHDGLRMGQTVWNMMNYHGLWEAPEANALFFIEDADLVDKLTDAYLKD